VRLPRHGVQSADVKKVASIEDGVMAVMAAAMLWGLFV
jgi:hypothetical protein